MTHSDDRTPPPARKLLGSAGTKVRIAAGSSLVLAVGALLAPPSAPTALSPPQERAAPLLEEQVQLRAEARPFRGVDDVPPRVRDYNVAIVPPDPPPVATRTDFGAPGRVSAAPGFGVRIADAYVLTHAHALDGRSAVDVATSDGRTVAAEVAAYDPETELVLLRTPAAIGPVATAAASPPVAGMLAVAVAPWQGRDIAVPVFVTHAGPERYRVSVTGGAVVPGMPVYTLDGELLAVTGDGIGEADAFPIRPAAAGLLARVDSGEQRVSFGLAFQPLVEPLAPAFGREGAVVSDVVPGAPAETAGLAPGDVLLAVGDRPVDSADAAVQALSAVPAGSAATVRVRRAGRVRTVELTAALAYEVAALARGAGRPAGVEARALLPPLELERAGIPAGAQVLAVNGRAVASRAQFQQELRRGRAPVLLRLFHGDRAYFAMLEQPAP